MAWNPEQYHKFRNERSAPFDDLFNLIRIREGLNVVDLGCGTGELTRRLADRLPGSIILGLVSGIWSSLTPSASPRNSTNRSCTVTGKNCG
jgi:trans-aconitate methyltransferase